MCVGGGGGGGVKEGGKGGDTLSSGGGGELEDGITFIVHNQKSNMQWGRAMV